jgi:hypothetical protein
MMARQTWSDDAGVADLSARVAPAVGRPVDISPGRGLGGITVAPAWALTFG